ncbi:MAG: homocysteine S-methyltransferase family protein, partial [Nocardioidaceae bacterium]
MTHPAEPHEATEAESPFLTALQQRVLVGDGGMGTALQAHDLTLADFADLEGCNEILNETRPDVVRSVHRSFLEAGSDAIESNTFGTNLANLGEYGIADRIRELAQMGAALARECADEYATPDKPRFVLGSMGPGTKLPTLGHAPYADLRDAYVENVLGMLDGGIDAVLVETSQDLLQTKAAVLGAKRAMKQSGRVVPIIAHVTVETTGTMLVGSEIGAALTSLEPLGIDMIGMNCATGPTEMSEHLRVLSQQATVPISVMPNAGLPEIGKNGAVYPLQPDELAQALLGFVNDFGARLVGGCCGTTGEHVRAVVEALESVQPKQREPEHIPSLSSMYQPVPFEQEAALLTIGERTNTNGSKAFRTALLDERYDDCVEIAKAQTREGAHLLDLCVDYVGRDGTADMRELAARLATASTLPIMVDSTEPDVIRVGLEHLGGRCAVNSVNYEDGDGPDSRFHQVMELVQEHGASVVGLCIDEDGQARTRDWKVRIAERL